jgi:hypothetical protein
MKALWFAAGTAAGVYATTKVRRAAEALTVDGIHDRLTGWFAGARVLTDEMRAGFLDKETELRTRMALVPDGNENVLQLDGRRRRTTGTDNNTEHTGKGDD